MRALRRLATPLLAAGVVLTIAGPALAAWNVGSSAATAGATATTLPVGPTPSAPVTGSQTALNITVSWPAVTYVGSVTEVSGYKVSRLKGGVADTVAGTCTGTIAAPSHSCADTVSTNGAYSYKVTPVGGSWTGTAGSASGTVTVTTAAVTSVSPLSRGQNSAAVVVTISGSGFTSGAGLSADFGAGTTTTGVTFGSSTTITASVAVASGAVTGVRSFTVTNGGAGGATMTCTNCFTVNVAPTITSPTSVSPAIVTKGTTANVTVTGTGFQNGIAGFIVLHDGIFTLNSVTFVSSTQVTVNVTATSSNNKLDGFRLTNPDGGVVTCTDCLKSSN